MKQLIKKLGNLRDSIPIDEKYYLLSQVKIENVKVGEIGLVFSELQAINNGLKFGNYAFYVTTEIRTSIVSNPLFNKTETENELIIADNLGDNIVNKKDHYGRDNRAGAYEAKKYYQILFVNLWVKSGSTQASKGDLCYFKEHTSLIVYRHD